MTTPTRFELLAALSFTFRTAFMPGRVIRSDEEVPRLNVAHWAVLVWGATYSALYTALAIGGHAPTMRKALPVEAEVYYGWAAVYVVPLCFALTWLVGAVGDRCAGGSSKGWRFGVRTLGVAYVAPLFWWFVVPDLIVFSVAGFDALPMAMRVTAPAALLVVLFRTYSIIRVAYDVGRGRAVVMMLGSAMAQLLPAAILVR